MKKSASPSGRDIFIYVLHDLNTVVSAWGKLTLAVRRLGGNGFVDKSSQQEVALKRIYKDQSLMRKDTPYGNPGNAKSLTLSGHYGTIKPTFMSYAWLLIWPSRYDRHRSLACQVARPLVSSSSCSSDGYGSLTRVGYIPAEI